MMLNEMLLPDNATEIDPTLKLRLITFIKFMDLQGRIFDQLIESLPDYVEYLRQDLQYKDSTINAYLSTVRSTIRSVLLDPNCYERLKAFAPETRDPEEFADKAYAQLREFVESREKYVTYRRDYDDFALTQAQIKTLLLTIPMKSNQDLRDLLILNLMLSTGLTITQMCALKLEDLFKNLNGRSAILLRDESKLLPIYDNYFFSEPYVERLIKLWIQEVISPIKSDSLLVGFYRGGNNVRRGNNSQPDSLTEIGLRTTLKTYTIQGANGTDIALTNSILRRTYARRLFIGGVQIEKIQENLALDTQIAAEQNVGLPSIQANEDQAGSITTINQLIGVWNARKYR